MDRDNDVALMHNLYYNYENLGGLTGQWEPENTDEDSSNTSSTPTSPRSDNQKIRSDNESNKKDRNENFTNGRASICDNPESPTFPRFPDITEDLVGSPHKIPSSVMKSTLEAAEASDEDMRSEDQGRRKGERNDESSTGNGEGVRWVFNTPFFYPNGTGTICVLIFVFSTDLNDACKLVNTCHYPNKGWLPETLPEHFYTI